MAEITPLKSTVSKSAIEQAERLLERCKTGEVTEFMVFEHLKDHKFRINQSYSFDRHQGIGMLMQLIFERLKD